MHTNRCDSRTNLEESNKNENPRNASQWYTGRRGSAVTFRLTGEFISVSGDDKEILDIYGFSVLLERPHGWYPKQTSTHPYQIPNSVDSDPAGTSPAARGYGTTIIPQVSC